MPEPRPLLVSSLLLDLENPRLAAGPTNQREALHALLRAERKKTLELARDISERGLSPSERLMVIASPDDPARFVVLEGNRRLAALRLLAEPKQNGDGVLKKPTLTKLEGWSRDYQKHPVTTVDCTLFATRVEANPWIERRHGGQGEGAGLVGWGAIEKMRFASRQNGIQYPELQILDFVAEHAELDDDVREKLHDFPITNLQRLVDDAEIQKRLGIQVEKRVTTKLPDAEAVKGWTRVVRDIAKGTVKVGDIYTASERRAYLDKFKKSELPDISKATQAARVVAVGSGGRQTSTASSTAKKGRGRVSPERKAMASNKCRLEISNPKIAKIYRELQTLAVDDFQNAAAVLFRVFLELTTDQYIATNGIKLTKGDWESLATKLSAVITDLKAKGVLSADELKALQYTTREKKIVGANIVTFHSYVHNKHFSPLPSDLRTYWDNLQHFFEKVWAK
jgi:hypothetical protein